MCCSPPDQTTKPAICLRLPTTGHGRMELGVFEGGLRREPLGQFLAAIKPLHVLAGTNQSRTPEKKKIYKTGLSSDALRKFNLWWVKWKSPLNTKKLRSLSGWLLTTQKKVSVTEQYCLKGCHTIDTRYALLHAARGKLSGSSISPNKQRTYQNKCIAQLDTPVERLE